MTFLENWSNFLGDVLANITSDSFVEAAKAVAIETVSSNYIISIVDGCIIIILY